MKNWKISVTVSSAFLALLAYLFLAVWQMPVSTGYAATSGTPLYGSTAVTPKYALSNLFTITAAFTNVPASLVVPDIQVYQGRGMAFTPCYVGTTACTTGQIGVAFAVSSAGTTNYTTTNNYLWVLFNPNAASTVYSTTNIPATILDNVEYIKLVQVTNNNVATNLLAYLTNVIITQRN